MHPTSSVLVLRRPAYSTPWRPVNAPGKLSWPMWALANSHGGNSAPNAAMVLILESNGLFPYNIILLSRKWSSIISNDSVYYWFKRLSLLIQVGNMTSFPFILFSNLTTIVLLSERSIMAHMWFMKRKKNQATNVQLRAFPTPSCSIPIVKSGIPLLVFIVGPEQERIIIGANHSNFRTLPPSWSCIIR